MRKRVSTRKICLLGVFAAITLILGIYATFRIGNQIKIPLKFITVFMTGMLFGPISAGSVAATADLLNATLMPVGAFLPQITLVEFLCGVIYGLCFYKARENKTYYLRCVICALLQLLIAMTVMSAVLVSVGYFPSFRSAVLVRFPAALVSFALQLLVMCGGRKLVFKLKKFISKDDLQ